MSSKRKPFFERFHDVLESWGIRLRGSEIERAPARLLLTMDVHGSKVAIGTLSVDEGEFVFEYDPSFAMRADLAPLPAFPAKGHVYRSKRLWPFFEVRIPPMDREDVKAELERRHLHESDVISVLAELGARTISSPFQFERSAA